MLPRPGHGMWATWGREREDDRWARCGMGEHAAQGNGLGRDAGRAANGRGPPVSDRGRDASHGTARLISGATGRERRARAGGKRWRRRTWPAWQRERGESGAGLGGQSGAGLGRSDRPKC
jgi:hypothetical protein